MGRGLGSDATNPGLYESYAAAEALEKWPLHYFQQILPRHLEIVFEINRRLLAEVRRRYPGDEPRVGRVSLIEEGSEKRFEWRTWRSSARTAPTGSPQSTPGCSRTTTVKDLAEVFPERFNNKTNGVTPRRWLLLANPGLSRVISDAIGDGWTTDLGQIAKLKPLAADFRVPRRLLASQTRRQIAVRQLVEGDLRADGRSRQHLRLPDQAYPRIQTADAQRASHHRAVQSIEGESGA